MSFALFQSTHSITECDYMGDDSYVIPTLISIHALHYRVRPRGSGKSICARKYFNPRTPLQSATLLRVSDVLNLKHFNPRTPLQSATFAAALATLTGEHFNPRTPLQSATMIFTMQLALLSTRFQSTHSITECDPKLS